MVCSVTSLSSHSLNMSLTWWLNSRMRIISSCIMPFRRGSVLLNEGSGRRTPRNSSLPICIAEPRCLAGFFFTPSIHSPSCLEP